MAKDMIIVIDDLFDDYSIVQDFLQEADYIEFAPKMVKVILDKASNYFDLSKMRYYESWTHKNTKPLEWHYDKDEKLYKKGELRFPLCSTVFYPTVSENLVGGKLVFENGVAVEPKINRLVVFAPGLYHAVQPFRGKRTSINTNPWIEL